MNKSLGKTKDPYRHTLAQTLALKAVQWFFLRVMKIYFKQLQLIETENFGSRPRRVRRPAFSSDQPTLLVANHPNSLVDVVMIYVLTGKTIRGVGKSTLWNMPYLRPLLWLAGAVPVYRKDDKGTELHSSAQKVSSNAEAIDLVAKAFWRHPFLVFPEGRSHDRLKLDPFKTGAARIILRSAELLQKNPEDNADLRWREFGFRPVGLYFDNKTKFRSRVLVHFGPRMSLEDAFTEEELSAIPNDFLAESVVDKLTSTMQESLENLLPAADSEETMVIMNGIATLMMRPYRKNPVAEQYRNVAAAEKVIEALEHKKNSELYPLIKDIQSYFADLEKLSVPDVIVRDLAENRGLYLFTAWFRQFRFDLWVIPALPLILLGYILYIPPNRLCGRLAKKLAEDNAELATYKVGSGIVILPLVTAIYSAIGFTLVALTAPAWAWIGALVPLLTAYLTLSFRERIHGRITELRFLFNLKARHAVKSLIPRRDTLVERIRSNFPESNP